jgi:OmpA-OmpF porin, OOP family
MRRGWRIAIAALSVLTLSACVGMGYNDVKDMEPKGSTFDQALYKGYVAQSKSEFTQGNYRSSDMWAKNAAMAAKGQTPKPTQVSDWRLPSAVVPEMTTARQRLQAALDKGGANAAPNEMAAAQVGWDCWCEQQRIEENFQPDDIAACRKMFYDTIAKVEAALAPKAPAPAPRAETPKDFLVFFDWSKATLTPEARKIIADAAAQAKAAGVKSIKVTGFTDRSGPADYNLHLSVRRAESVRAEFVRLGIPAGNIAIEGRGEEDPLVPTADGVREPQNRRASIALTKPAASLNGNDDKVFVHIGFVK